MGATSESGTHDRPEEGGPPPPPVVVLVAFEPRSHREAIGGAMQALRPRLQVRVVEPIELGAEVTHLNPELVLSGQPDTSTTSDGGGPSWLEFRPYEGPSATLCIGGRRSELEKVGLDDLLSVVDRVQALTGSLSTPATAPGRRR